MQLQADLGISSGDFNVSSIYHTEALSRNDKVMEEEKFSTPEAVDSERDNVVETCKSPAQSMV